MIKAIIYVPLADLTRSAIACIQYAAAAGYHVAGIVVDRWDDAQSMAFGGRGLAEVVVVAERSQIPRDRVPRIEVVEEQATPETPPPTPAEHDGPSTPPGRRRPKPVA